MEKTSQHTTSFPPLKTLFSDSFEMFKGSLLNLVILWVITMVIFAALFIIMLLIALPLGFFSILSGIQSQSLTPAFFASLGGIGVIVGAGMIVGVIISIAIQAATILVVANYKQKPNVGHSLKQGFSYVIPLFVASIIMGFIVSGGYLLFIIPGIIFQTLFVFVMYEIVLNKKGVLSACRRSMGIVLAHFWEVFGRMLLMGIAVYAISFIPGFLVGLTGNDSLQSVTSIFTMIISFLVSFYTVSYVVTLYSQAEKAAPANKTGKLMWPVITAVIGWVMGIILTVTILYAVFTILIPQIQNAMKAKENAKMMQEIQKGESMDPNMILQMLPTGSPERAQLQKELDALEKYNESGKNASNSMMMER